LTTSHQSVDVFESGLDSVMDEFSSDSAQVDGGVTEAEINAVSQLLGLPRMVISAHVRYALLVSSMLWDKPLLGMMDVVI
jgi:hypothetical protein